MAISAYDLVIQLGSQVKWFEDDYYLAEHTRMRTEASAIVFKTSMASRLMICGGSNFGVRYCDQSLLKPPDFSFEAFAVSDYFQSEAAVIKHVLVTEYKLPSDKIFAETLSSTTEENAAFAKIILARRPMFTGNERIGLLTQLYHMERALPIFRQAGLNVEPVFVENILATDNPERIKMIYEYYNTPKGGKQYPMDRLHELLAAGQSLAELMG